jgi:hypothetical protein
MSGDVWRYVKRAPGSDDARWVAERVLVDPFTNVRIGVQS